MYFSLKGIGISCSKAEFVSDFGRLAKEHMPGLTLIGLGSDSVGVKNLEI